MPVRHRLLFLFSLALGLILSASVCVCALEAEGLLFGFGPSGWREGLGLSQETIRQLGFFGYEKTGVGGFLAQDTTSEQVSSWFGGHKEVLMGNFGYTLELFVGNTQRPIFSIFTHSVAPHIGAYGEVKRIYGDYGHGLSGTAQLFMNTFGQIEYCISPYVQFYKQGVWRFSASLGSFFGLGMSYLEPEENLQFDITLVNDALNMHILLSVPDLPITFGAGWAKNRMQAFLRYSF